MSFFKRLFGRKPATPPPAPEFSEEQYEKDYDVKMAGLEQVLGSSYHLVGHAIVPFAIGGAVDMYYFPNHIKGTGFATMELLDPAGNGPLPNRLGTYELVAFTQNDYSEEKGSAFALIERKLCGVFTNIGNYCTEAVLNPGETCEVPGNKGEENIGMLFDLYEPDDKKFTIDGRQHHLLLCLLLFRSELDFARKNGSGALLEKLKTAGHYPYSDLDRDPVV